MKIAFPTQKDKGMDSQVYGHFGSAPHFILVDSENNDYESIINPDLHHQHGQCNPLAALSGRSVDAVATGGIGAGALTKLSSAGIKSFRAIEGTVSENLDLIKSGLLPIFTMNKTCAGHDTSGGCAH